MPDSRMIAKWLSNNITQNATHTMCDVCVSTYNSQNKVNDLDAALADEQIIRQIELIILMFALAVWGVKCRTQSFILVYESHCHVI